MSAMARKKKEVLPPEHCASVREYEKSNWWRKKSQALLDDKDVVCEICGRPRFTWMPRKKVWKKRRFSLHHKTYQRAPNEYPSDFMFLCNLCHSESHKILQCENVGQMYKELAAIVRKYFFYDGIDTFKGW